MSPSLLAHVSLPLTSYPSLQTPSWVYWGLGIGIFVYQTLDAIDGKQARRTNSSSPLGELFDHGCDAVTCGLLVLSILLTLDVGSSVCIVGRRGTAKEI